MEWQKIFSPGSTFCADSCFSIHSIPILPREHIKYPGHSARSAGGKLQLHIYIHMHSSNLVLVCGFCIMQHCKLVYMVVWHWDGRSFTWHHWCAGLCAQRWCWVYGRLVEAKADFLKHSVLSEQTVLLSRWFQATTVLEKFGVAVLHVFFRT